MADTTRKLTIWVNGEEVETKFKNISASMAKARNELAKMTIGSKEYIAQTNEIRKLKSVMDEHKKMQGQIATGWDKVGGSIKQIAVGNFLSNVFTNIAGTISNLFTDAYQKIKDFGKGISELEAITGASGKDLDYLKDRAKELGATYGKSATEIVEAMKMVGSAKPELLSNVAALGKVTEAVLTLSNASGMDLATATSSLTTIMNQFGHGAELANEDINILAAGSKYGAVEVDYLSEAISKVGTVANAAGLTLQQTTAAMELFGEKGVKAEVAGTGFKSVLVELQKDSKNYTNGIFDLNKAIDNNQKISGDNIKLQEKFGKEYFSLAQILMQNRDRFNELTTQVTGTNTAFEQAAIAMDNLQGDLDKMGGAWDRFVLSIEDGDGVLSKAFRSVTQSWTEFLKVGTDKMNMDWGEAMSTMFSEIKDELYKFIPGLERAISGLKEFFNLNSSPGGPKKTTQNPYMTDVENLKEANKLKEQENARTKAWIMANKPDELSDKEAEKLEKQAKAEALRKAKEQKAEAERAMNELVKAQEDLQKTIKELRQKGNYETLSEEDRMIAEITDKYNDQLAVVDGFITELEAKQQTKEGLNNQELDLLNKFYDQTMQLTELRDAEIITTKQKFEDKKLEEKKKVEEKIFELTASATEKEEAEIYKKYEDLIAAAKKYGLDTYELYQKMLQEIDALTAGGSVADTDLFGMTPADWEKLSENFENVMKVATSAQGILGAFYSLQNAKEQAALATYENNAERKKAALQDQLDSGAISQEDYNEQIEAIDKKLEIQKKKSAIAEAKRNKNMQRISVVLATAAAIMNALTVIPLVPLGVGLAASAGITGALQLAAINKTPLPQMAKGARVNIPTIAEIGEAGPEIVLSNSIVGSKQYGPIADDLARIQEGKKPRFLGQPSTPNFSGINKVIGGGSTNVVTNNTVINQVDNKSIDKMNEKIEFMTQSMTKMTEEVSKIKFLRAVITNDDMREFEEDEKTRLRYSGF